MDIKASSTAPIGAIVLGMGRSGTSAVTQMLVSAGFFAGLSSELMVPLESNPLGHFEHLGIVAVNEEILGELGGSWQQPPPRAAQLSAREHATHRVRAQLQALVERSDGAPIAVKDPRVGMLLPIWGPLIDELFMTVLTVRHPLEIAQSLAQRDGTPLALGLAMWELHTTGLLSFLNGRTAIVAPYEQLIATPEIAVLIVNSVVDGLDDEQAGLVAAAAAPAALATELRHHRASARDAEEMLTGRQLNIWKLLEQLPAGAQRIEANEQLWSPTAVSLDAVNAERHRLRVAGSARDAERLPGELAEQRQQAQLLVGERDDLTRQLDLARADADAAAAGHAVAVHWLNEIKGSASWRLTSPLRRVMRWLRRAGRGVRGAPQAVAGPAPQNAEAADTHHGGAIL